MNTAVIILNWNQSADTMRSFRAVSAWTSIAPEIWVVDNASRDDERKKLAQGVPRERLILSDRNSGFAGGNNLALKRILAGDAGTVLMLNNDASIEESHVLRMLEELQERAGVGIAGPVIDERREARRYFSAGGRDIAKHIHTRMKFSHEDLSSLAAANRIMRVDYVPGTVALVKTEVFRAAGLFDEDYFFSGEMADFCRRARERGYASVICPRSRADHFTRVEARSALYLYYTLRNRFLYIRKFERSRREAFLLSSGWSAVAFAMELRALTSSRGAEARAVRIAALDGLAGRFGNRNELFGA